MRHYETELKKRHAVSLISIAVVLLIAGGIYFAQVKIPQNDQLKKREFRNMSLPILDSIFEQDMKEEFENLPLSDQKTVRQSLPDFWRSVPH